MEFIRTLIVDDHAPFREGLRAMLEMSDDIEVADEAAGGERALALAREVRPDVVLLGAGGVTATERLLQAVPGLRVLVLSATEDDDSASAAAIRAGARGHVHKGARKADVLRAVRTAAAHAGP